MFIFLIIKQYNKYNDGNGNGNGNDDDGGDGNGKY